MFYGSGTSARRHPHLYDLMLGPSIHCRHSLSRGTATPLSNDCRRSRQPTHSWSRRAPASLMPAPSENSIPLHYHATVECRTWICNAGTCDHFAAVADSPSGIVVPMYNT